MLGVGDIDLDTDGVIVGVAGSPVLVEVGVGVAGIEPVGV
jgi:hypothetical protein